MSIDESCRAVTILVYPVHAMGGLILFGERIVEAVAIERTVASITRRYSSFDACTDFVVAAGEFVQVALDVDGRFVTHSDHHVEVGRDRLAQLLIARNIDF